MSAFLTHLLGPRVPAEELRRHSWRYVPPTIMLSLARILLLVSVFLPYWHMDGTKGNEEAA